MAIERLSTTRRAVLSAALALPAAGMAAGLPAGASPGCSAWNKALTIYEQAKAATATANETFLTIHDVYASACETIPHTTLGPDPYSGIQHALSTANINDVLHARRSLIGVVRWDDVPSINEHFAVCKELIAADDARKAEADRFDARLGYNAAGEKVDRLADAECEAQETLMLLPAPDAEALRWKLERLLGEESRNGDDRSGSAWCAAWLDAVMADAHRLLPVGTQS